jgi:YYY domain-containing protein
VFVAVVGNLAELEIVLRSITRSIPIEWWYWNASRAISHPPDEPGPITEFPAFTFLYADLHAHAIALPFTVAALVLLIAHVRARGRDRGATIARLALIALLLGTLWVTNTWDFPTYAALILAALVLPAVVGRARRLPAAFSGAAVWLVIVCSAYLLFLPFHAHYLSTFAGVAVWHGSRTSLVDYLTIHGFFLFLIASALVVDLAQARDLNAVARAVRIAVRRPRRGLRLHRALVSPRPSYGAGLALLGVAVPGALALAVAGESVAALAFVLGTLISLLIVRTTRRGIGPPRLWQATLLLALVGLLLTVAVEYLVVAAIDIGRNNTVFKTYLQVWVFWGIAAAVATHRVYEQLPRLRLGWRVAWRTAFVALFSVTLLYPLLATRAKIDDRFDPSIGRTLDGMAFMAKAVYTPRDEPLLLAHDLAAIRWMQNEIDGSPVVAEVNTYPVLYGWGNRYAMFTGNQAVIGWDFHERQQRGLADPEAVPQRIADAQRLYETPDAREAHRILLRYGVDYVVVGSLERSFFPDGQQKWASGRGTLWDVAYRNPGVQIYRVRRGGTQ